MYHRYPVSKGIRFAYDKEIGLFGLLIICSMWQFPTFQVPVLWAAREQAGVMFKWIHTMMRYASATPLQPSPFLLME